MEKLRSRLSRRRQRLTSCDSQVDQAQDAGCDHGIPSGEAETRQSSAHAATQPFADGVEILHDRRDADVDIYFVHGLTGNRDSTWTATGPSAPWPQVLLPPRLCNARILTYGYDAYIVRKSVASTNGLSDHAKNLLNDLTTNRASSNASSRPVIFVAHSLSGLVCKEAILLSRNNPEPHLRGVFDCTKGIAFMGTPHRGSWMADWAKIPAAALGIVKSTNRSLLKVLETDDAYRHSVQDRFWSMIREQQLDGRALEVTCFFEELPLSGVGKVVSKDSATLESYNAISIHANHSNMVKIGSVDDNGFKRLLGELLRWESQIRNSTTRHERRPIEDAHNAKPANSSFNNCGTGDQLNAPGGTQNVTKGSGSQFPGATFHGPTTFGSSATAHTSIIPNTKTSTVCLLSFCLTTALQSSNLDVSEDSATGLNISSDASPLRFPIDERQASTGSLEGLPEARVLLGGPPSWTDVVDWIRGDQSWRDSATDGLLQCLVRGSVGHASSHAPRPTPVDPPNLLFNDVLTPSSTYQASPNDIHPSCPPCRLKVLENSERSLRNRRARRINTSDFAGHRGGSPKQNANIAAKPNPWCNLKGLDCPGLTKAKRLKPTRATAADPASTSASTATLHNAGTRIESLRGREFDIQSIATDKVVKVAAGNYGNGKEVIELLFNRRGGEITITHGVVEAAARNHDKGKEVMELLLNRRGEEAIITAGVVREAAGNEGCGTQVMELLFDRRGYEISITDEVLTAAAGNRGSGKEVMALLLNRRGHEIAITGEVVKAAAGNDFIQRGSAETASRLAMGRYQHHKGGYEISITNEVLKEAAGNEECGEEVMALLLNRRGHDITITDEVVAAAATCGQDGVLDLLSQNGLAHVSTEWRRVAEFYNSAKFGDISGIQQLLRAGIEPDTRNIRSETPLWVAASKGNSAVVHVLVQVAAVDVNSKSISGRSPLWWPSCKGMDRTVTILMDAGADPYLVDKNGATPITMARRNGHERVAKILERVGELNRQAAVVRMNWP
ncbi:hypothetical protein Purlil1_13291 [Purpureocillium lilacinum]|uniref:NACHT-NTPase sigma domain-containing protein n=1 Tax=Purpureocillium lilacinum TaxID=33203 RepID=A0ABR0BEG7_PURLI|nr:hypothetical protein Purlil1_13291 [Purpureocillium lilacinum]